MAPKIFRARATRITVLNPTSVNPGSATDMGYNDTRAPRGQPWRVLIRILNLVSFSNFSEIATTLSLVSICS